MPSPFGIVRGAISRAGPSPLADVLGTPTPVVPPTPPTPPQNYPPLVPPQPREIVPPIARRGGAGTDVELKLPGLPPMPGPRQVPEPPPAAAELGGGDYSKAREFLKQAEPKRPDTDSTYIGDILGGLAKGAAGVDPTKPGSFAAALAAAGAGGEAGRSASMQRDEERQDRYQREVTAHRTAQAGQEMSIARQEADLAARRQEVAQHHLDQVWHSQLEQGKANSENERWQWEQRKPVLQHDANGVYSLDPVSGEFRYHSTKPASEAFQSMAATLKALGMPAPMIDAVGLNMYMGDKPGEPPMSAEAKVEAAKRFLADRALSDPGMARAIFGKQYEMAEKKVLAQFKDRPDLQVLLGKDPASYQKIINDNVKAMLLTELLKPGNIGWVYDLANAGNDVAKMMTGGAR